MSLILKIRNRIQSSISREQVERLRKIQAHKFRVLQYIVHRLFFGRNLKALALLCGTDKWGGHQYAQHYANMFSPLRKKRLNILEIGIGGYDDPMLGGGSLRMWRTYFPKSRIYGIDIHDKSMHDERRIKTLKGSQVDEDFLTKVIETIGHIDIIIDDGSHLNEHVIKTFSFLFPKLQENGIYVVEDTQTSYWNEYGGTSEDLSRQDTSMGFLKQLVDGINYTEYKKENYEPSYYDKHIVGMHFFHNIVFIEKGQNS